MKSSVSRRNRFRTVILLALFMLAGWSTTAAALTATIEDCRKCHCDIAFTGDLHHTMFTYKILADNTTTMYYNLPQSIGPHYYKERWECFGCHVLITDQSGQFHLSVDEATCNSCHRAVDPFHGTGSEWMDAGHHLNATDCSVCHRQVRVKGATEMVFTENCAASGAAAGGGGKK
ncbi:MAG: hypothetical protein Kow0089_13080 [Desulfobulbaceae bacterium]